MALDEQSQQLLEQIKALNLPPANTVTPSEARENYASRPRLPGPELPFVKDMNIILDDVSVPCRLYKPELNKTLPIIVWFHGGGWVIGSVDGSDGTARHLALGSGFAVLSVDYRLAPETKYPGPFNDCYGVTKWVYENADQLDIDPKRISVGGDSAGGNLAAAVSLKTHDEAVFKLQSQLLIYPCLDSNFTRKSYIANDSGYVLTAPVMKWFWEQYTNSPADLNDPYVCPMKYPDFTDLPKTMIIVADHDPLYDEGVEYHNRLLEANVCSSLIEFTGVMHGFFSQVGVLDKSQKAMNDSCNFLTGLM
ncbi:MAG: alpha/beta hydrolase [SAR202 cluster bacterium]|nr:alpha/beta hydrolase [SAR202 cluster bacterium]|tara:strand:- start:1206 stop:2126 length:921 start_codon:yes stop_codon:yes gene_type:complete